MVLTNQKSKQGEPAKEVSKKEELIKEVEAIAYTLRPNLRQQVRIDFETTLDEELALDSLSRVELFDRIGKQLGAEIPEQNQITIETVGDIWDAVKKVDATKTTRQQSSSNSKGKISRTTQRSSAINSASMVEALYRHSELQGEVEHVILLDQKGVEQPISYAGLVSEAEKISSGLIARGVRYGDRIAIMLPSSFEYLASFVGIQLCGAIPVPIYPPARPSQLEDHLKRHSRILQNAGVKWLLSFSAAKIVAQWLNVAVDSLQGVIDVEELKQGNSNVFPYKSHLHEIAFLQYTSGSTGQPKGVVLSHTNLMESIRSMAKAIRIQPSDTFVSWLPLYHDMGLIGAWLGSMVHGSRLVLMSPLKFITHPYFWLQTIERYQAKVSGGPNFAYALCNNRIHDKEIESLDLSSWKIAFNGAEPINVEVMQTFCRKFAKAKFETNAMTPVYGLAEATLGVTFSDPDAHYKLDWIDADALSDHEIAKPVNVDANNAVAMISTGSPIPGFKIRIANSMSNELSPRTVGNIQFKGPGACLGYYNNEKATKALHDKQWFETGDRGYISNGELYISGRNKDVIIRAGRNLYPYAFEQAVGELNDVHKGGVAAMGVQDESMHTEKIVAVVETSLTDQKAKDALTEQIQQKAIQHFGMAVDHVCLVGRRAVLKTSSGKLRRKDMAELYLSGELYKTRNRSVKKQALALAMRSFFPTIRKSWRNLKQKAYSFWVKTLLYSLVTLSAVLTYMLPTISIRQKVVGTICNLFFKLAAIKVNVNNLDLWPDEGPAIICTNHQSYLDAVAITSIVPKPVRFVAKSELRQTPILNGLLERLGVIFVERFEKKQALKDTEVVNKHLQAGEMLVFFPEGTFIPLSGLLPFQLGAFNTAFKNNVVITPIVLKGFRDITIGDNNYLPNGIVTMEVLPVIQPKKYDEQSDVWTETVKLRDQVRSVMLEHCEEPDLNNEYVMAALRNVLHGD